MTTKTRPDLLVHTLNELAYGAAAVDGSEKLAEAVDAARTTGKTATLTIELKIKPMGRETGQYEIAHKFGQKLPKLDVGSTIMFGTPEGNLQREDPRQQKLDLRVAKNEKPDTFKSAN